MWSTGILNLLIVVLAVRVSVALKCYLCSDDIYKSSITGRRVQQPAGEVRWRSDLRCGPGFKIDPNITDSDDAECNPDAGNECCSSDGWCGSTSHHCCSECVKYTRSFSDFDLPMCDHDDLDKTFGECDEEEDVCEVVKIATNTTDADIDRYLTIRKCGNRDTEPCLKYTNAGHTCLASRQCSRGRCNKAAGSATGSWFLITILIVATTVC